MPCDASHLRSRTHPQPYSYLHLPATPLADQVGELYAELAEQRAEAGRLAAEAQAAGADAEAARAEAAEAGAAAEAAQAEAKEAGAAADVARAQAARALQLVQAVIALAIGERGVGARAHAQPHTLIRTALAGCKSGGLPPP